MASVGPFEVKHIFCWSKHGSSMLHHFSDVGIICLSKVISCHLKSWKHREARRQLEVESDGFEFLFRSFGSISCKTRYLCCRISSLIVSRTLRLSWVHAMKSDMLLFCPMCHDRATDQNIRDLTRWGWRTKFISSKSRNKTMRWLKSMLLDIFVDETGEPFWAHYWCNACQAFG